MKRGFSVGLLTLAAVAAHAAGTATWEMNSFRDFVAGRLTGVSLTRDGRLLLAPRLETLLATDQPVIWSIAQSGDGALYAGTGHRGRLFRVDRSGASSVLWTADQPEVFAVAVDRKGAVYAGTSPKGKIYRIENGNVSEFFSPGAVYIWALAFGADGSLYAGTGDQGRIYRIEPSGKSELYFDTGQSHVTALAFDANGRLLAGTEPNGILYRIEAKDKAFVLYDADLPEIRSVFATADGVVYAAAMGGGSLGRTLTGSPATRTTPGGQPVGVATTSITVTDEAQGGVEIKPKPDTSKPAIAAIPPAVATTMPAVDLSGVDKSAIYRIAADNTVETLWTSKEENLYDLLPTAGDLLFSTDGQGRIYRLGADRKVTLLVQTNEGEATRLVQTSLGLLAATGDAGKVLRLGSEVAETGVFEAPVHDVGTVARWGRMSWRAETGDGRRITFFTRTGNSARPDRTWSDWSETSAEPGGGMVRSPNARFIQWKAEFSGMKSQTPILDGVTVTYLPQNTPPVVRGIQVASIAAAAPASASRPAAAQPASSSFSITVTDTGDPAPATSAGTPTQALSRSGGRQLQITWQAEDRDGDRLVYALYFRGEDEREWKLIKRDLYESTYQLDGDALSDGRYFFRVTASDLPGNPREAAREAELVSSPILIDNTPPSVTAGAPRWSGRNVEIEFVATDAAGGLRRAEYSLNAGPWTPVQASDGVTDSPRESFLVRIENVPPGEQLVVLRVYDASENAGLSKVVLR